MITFEQTEHLANNHNMSLEHTYQYILRDSDGKIVISSEYLIDIINYLRNL